MVIINKKDIKFRCQVQISSSNFLVSFVNVYLVFLNVR